MYFTSYGKKNKLFDVTRKEWRYFKNYVQRASRKFINLWVNEFYTFS